MKASFATTDELIDLLTYVVEDVSRRFDNWDSQYVRGPSLYFVVAAGARFDGYADPLGVNRWPIDTAHVVSRDLDPVIAAAEEIAFDCDGAVIVMRSRFLVGGPVSLEEHLGVIEIEEVEFVISGS